MPAPTSPTPPPVHAGRSAAAPRPALLKLLSQGAGDREPALKTIDIVLLCVLTPVVFVLGMWGFYHYLGHGPGFWTNLLESFFATVQLFGGAFKTDPANPARAIPAVLMAARFLALTVTFVAVLRAYLLLFSRVRERAAVFRRRRGLEVVCGLGERGLFIVRQLRSEKSWWKRPAVIVIDSDAGNPFAQTARSLGALVLIGDATSPAMLRRAAAGRAAKVHIMIDDDARAIAAALACGEIAEKRKGGALKKFIARCPEKDCPCVRRAGRHAPLVCHVHVQWPRSREVFSAHSVFRNRGEKFAPRIIEDNRLAARQALIDFAGVMIAPSHRSPLPPHILIIGAGCIGQNLIVQMAHILHPGSRRPIRISVVDTAADREEEFHCQYPFVSCKESHLSLRLNKPVFHQGDIAHCNKAFVRKIVAAQDGCPVSGVFVCISNEMAALSGALVLRPHAGNAPIVVCTDNGDGLAKLFNDPRYNADAHKAQNIHIYNLTNSICANLGAGSDRYENMARALNADYLLREEQAGRETTEDSKWENLSEETRDSNRNQAADLILKLACFGYKTTVPHEDGKPPPGATLASEPLYSEDPANDELELLAEMEHRRWMVDKFMGGWTPGEETDPARKTNKHMVPWTITKAGIKPHDREPIRNTLKYLKENGCAVWR